jgi:SNF2 family DNA or RNA helicase
MDASEPGTGKTRTAILTLMERMRKGQVRRALVICPKTLLWSWHDEMWKHAGRKCTLVTGSSPEKEHILNRNSKVFVTNYETTIHPDLLKKIMQLKFDMVIWDESTYLKNHQSKRSQVNYIIGGGIKFKLMLTGTPITDSIQDVYSQFKVLDGGRTFGGNYSKFIRYFYKPVWNYIPGQTFYRYGAYWVQKTGAKEALWQKLKPSVIRFKKEDCLDLPEKVFVKRYVDWVPKSEQYKDYVMVEEDLVSDLKKSVMDGGHTLDDLLFKENITIEIRGVLSKFSKLQQIGHGFLYTGAGDVTWHEYDYDTNPKLAALEEVIGEYSSRGQIVVYSPFIHDRELILKGKLGKDFTNDVREFRAGKKQFFIGSQLQAGVGLNFQNASTMIFYGHHWGLEKFVQSQDRIHRIGQNKKCLYVHLLMRDSIDEEILEKLENKWKTAESVMEFLRKRIVP